MAPTRTVTSGMTGPIRRGQERGEAAERWESHASIASQKDLEIHLSEFRVYVDQTTGD